MLVYCTEITAMHRDTKEVAARKSITKLSYSTNELWSRAGEGKWHSRFKNSILVLFFFFFSRWFVLKWVVSPNIQNQSLICEEIVLLIIQYPLTVISSHCMFDVNPFVKLGTFAVIRHFVLVWPKLKFKEICCPGWIITKWVSFVHTCKVHISKKLYKSFQSNLINVFYRTRKLISAAKWQRKFEYVIHIRNLKWIHRKHWMHWMRIRFVHYKLSWMQEKGAVLFQLILHIEAGGDYHTSVKYECASFYIWTWKCQ